MSWARFPRDQLAKAEAEGRAAVIVGYDGKYGRYECVFRPSHDDGIRIWELAQAINLRLLTDEEKDGLYALVEEAYGRAKREREASA